MYGQTLVFFVTANAGPDAQVQHAALCLSLHDLRTCLILLRKPQMICSEHHIQYASSALAVAKCSQNWRLAWHNVQLSFPSGALHAQVTVRRNPKEKSCGKQRKLTAPPTNKPKASLRSLSWMTHRMTRHQGPSQPPTGCHLSSIMSHPHTHAPAADSSTARSPALGSPQAQQAIIHPPHCHNQAAGLRAADSCPPPSRARQAALPSQAAAACASSSTQTQLVTSSSSSSSSSQAHRAQLTIT